MSAMAGTGKDRLIGKIRVSTMDQVVLPGAIRRFGYEN
jgi:hypothetical protein